MFRSTGLLARTRIVRVTVASAALLLPLAIGTTTARSETASPAYASSPAAVAASSWGRLSPWLGRDDGAHRGDHDSDHHGDHGHDHGRDDHGHDHGRDDPGCDHDGHEHAGRHDDDGEHGHKGERGDDDHGRDEDADEDDGRGHGCDCGNGHGHHKGVGHADHGNGHGYGHDKHDCDEPPPPPPPPPKPVPTAAFTYSPSVSVATRPVAFDASVSSGGVDGTTTGTIVSYAWDFGDRQTGEGVSVGHVFASGGDFTVALTVTNDYGQSAVATQSVHVVAAPVPVAVFTHTPGAPIAGRAVRFDATGSSGGVTSDPTGDVTGVVVSYDWDFGDQSAGQGAAIEHTYAAAGDYPVTLTVTNDYGQTATMKLDLHVVPPPPPYPGGGGDFGVAGEPATVAPMAAGTTSSAGSGRIAVRTSVAFEVPDGVAPATACVGDAVAKGVVRGLARASAVGKLRASGDRCVAPFKLMLPRSLAGKQAKLVFSFAGNEAVAAWRLTRTVKIKRRG